VAQVTIADVAKAAGVSKRTVSRVINGDPLTKTETREKVLAVIEQLGFSPNVLAQRLARGQTGIIGVFAYLDEFPASRENFFYPFLEGIELAAQAKGYDLLLFTQGPQGEECSMFVGNQNRTQIADGLIILGTRVNQGDLARLNALEIPFVCIGRRSAADGSPVHWVGADYQTAFRESTDQLIGLGHRRLALVGDGYWEANVDKTKGFRDAMDKHGLPAVVVDEKRPVAEVLEQVVIKQGITALVCIAAGLAARYAQALAAWGLQIPEDISLVGFNEEDVGTADFTQVCMPRQAMGRRAVSLLIRKLQNKTGPAEAKQFLLPCDVVTGTSTAVPGSLAARKEE